MAGNICQLSALEILSALALALYEGQQNIQPADFDRR